MTTIDLRKEFLMTIGKTYEQYGYPEYCGWIEGLLQLETQEWSQRGISRRLGELFSASKYPTSVPSVNRALKILENYGVVEKAGSRKAGYRYRVVSSTNLVASMLQQLIAVNQEFIMKMEDLATRSKKTDSDLRRAVSSQIDTAKVWNRAVELILDEIKE